MKKFFSLHRRKRSLQLPCRQHYDGPLLLIVRKTLNQVGGTAGDEGTDAERNRESGNDGRE